jgi:hypothetical protein
VTPARHRLDVLLGRVLGHALDGALDVVGGALVPVFDECVARGRSLGRRAGVVIDDVPRDEAAQLLSGRIVRVTQTVTTTTVIEELK